MFALSEEELIKLGAKNTTKEIKQEPELWRETYAIYQKNKVALASFIEEVISQANGKKVKIIFTGAGTSEYVGETITPYLQTNSDRDKLSFYSIGTTDLVSTPHYFFYPEDTVLLVSFARSGNSPESVAAVNLANQFLPNVYHLFITCNPEGELAKIAEGKENAYLFLTPERSNDLGFAMTGSFSCMMLSALLVFDQKVSEDDKSTYVELISSLAEDVIKREAELQSFVDKDFKRIVYLGSGSLKGLTREAQLKILELTAGQISTVYDSSMGFRHGPKSFVNEETLVIDFVNNDPYTRQYDIDILEEVKNDNIAVDTIAITQVGDVNFTGTTFAFAEVQLLPDAYLAFPMIVVAQIISLLSSIKVNNLPDTPSATGTVNRVVKGVTIHPYEA
ncbi:SIS domain-containing protein [Streptococcus hongkongensis]|nr:tagatose-6-phosphate ketose isomerase [Streptococcus uberis]